MPAPFFRSLPWLAFLSFGAGGLIYGLGHNLPWLYAPMVAAQTVASQGQRLAQPTDVDWIALSSLVLVVSPLAWWRSRRDRQPWASPRAHVGVLRTGLEERGLRVAPLQRYRLCRLRGRDRQQYLALRVGQDYYTFYRQRSSLQQATCLVAQWQRRGYAALATHDLASDKSTYAVWVRGLYLPSVFPSG